MTIGLTTVCWVITAFVGPETDHQTLIDFYRKVHPIGPGWTAIREEAGVDRAEAARVRAAGQHSDGAARLGDRRLGDLVGLFTVGNVLYGRWNYAAVLFGILLITGTILIRVIQRLWR